MVEYRFDSLDLEENRKINTLISQRPEHITQTQALRTAMKEIYLRRVFKLGGMEAEDMYYELVNYRSHTPKEAYEIIRTMDWPIETRRKEMYNVIPYGDRDGRLQRELFILFATFRDINIETVYETFCDELVAAEELYYMGYNDEFWNRVRRQAHDELTIIRRLMQQRIRNSERTAPFGGG